MKVAIFDCPQGIAGDMTLGALLDAGMPFRLLEQELRKLKLHGYKLSAQTIKCGAFRAKKLSVEVEHYHHHTPLREIEKIIRASSLHPHIKKMSLTLFRNLGRAEARVHGIPLQEVHFHEAGAVDSFIDMVGAAICFHHLGIRKAFVRDLRVGRGLQAGAHGKMPIPVPGAYELLKGFILHQTDYEQEMITPTGAAILATFCEKNPMKIPPVRILSIGYGAGDRTFDGEPGMVRVSVAELADKAHQNHARKKK